MGSGVLTEGPGAGGAAAVAAASLLVDVMTKIPNRAEPMQTRAPLLVATLGPTSVGIESDLAAFGVSQFRLNASHMTRDGLCERIAAAHRLAPGVPVIVDLQGAKMRLGDFEPCTVEAGARLRFAPERDDLRGLIPLPHPEAYSALSPGDRVSIDDGRLSGLVEHVEAGALVIRLLNGGALKSRKGFNREAHPVVLNDLCARDVELARAAYASGCRAFAVSFVENGCECDWVRRLFSDVQVVAKIERQDALANFDSIAKLSDALWICRGDLGVQLGFSHLARAVASIDPTRFERPIYMAGQVLEHLTAHRDATRSEICHVYDLVQRGYAGIVLSDETAIGCDPVNAARLARSFLDAARD